LIRQLLTESVVLSVAGGLLGIAFAIGITKLVVTLMPSFYVPNEARITVNSWVLLFSAAVSVATGILFGLMPALECSRPNLTDSLKEGARGTAGSARGQKTRRVLVVAEVALSMILLSAASLAIRNFAGLMKTDPGFHPEKTLMVSVQLSPKKYATFESRNLFSQTLLDRVKNLPGVEAASMGNGGMPFGGPRSAFSIEGQTEPQKEQIIMGLISADYAKTLEIPLRRGRPLTDQDVARGDRYALINETAAKLWPAGIDPIGKRVSIDVLAKGLGRNALLAPGSTADVTVVGILGDTKNAGLRDAARPAVFVPYTLVAVPARVLGVRTRGEPMAMLNTLRRVAQEMDREVPLSRPITMEEVMGYETVQPKFNMALFSGFAGLGLLLAAAGIYSVISYDVTQRIHEIGVRLALGASKGDVLAMVLKMASLVVAVGMGIGLAVSATIHRIARWEVFEKTSFDPWSAGAVVGVLACVALVAALIPAYRAAKLDPLVALRQD
jgi:putative ABC transport system permease protein